MQIEEYLHSPRVLVKDTCGRILQAPVDFCFQGEVPPVMAGEIVYIHVDNFLNPTITEVRASQSWEIEKATMHEGTITVVLKSELLEVDPAYQEFQYRSRRLRKYFEELEFATVDLSLDARLNELATRVLSPSGEETKVCKTKFEFLIPSDTN